MASITRKSSHEAEENRAAVEARVLAAVEKMLNEGMRYTEVSVQRIILEAKIARSTFYAHFRDKADVLSRLAAAVRKEVFEAADSVWDAMEVSDGVSALTRIFEQGIAGHRRHFAVLSAISEMATYDSGVRDFYTSDLDDFETRVIRDLENRRQAGLTAASLDPAAASKVVVWGGEQAIARHISTADPSGDAAFARELAEIWWYGVYCRRQQPAPPAS
ncbi:TetR/AcrR family transcriptional regulator [Streptomyces sp. NBC_01198]|uniref:TetR/AcrR family transcriptional regulator n=1 Tax=Streptomyces sp. NBC_01198 TaxID=2903769 RepID=UPI002E0FCEE9|nr:TetR family transcriptional regulator [Streptomyces sp. NBC_01198]